MNTERCDVLVIGGGPGGISAASKVVLRGKKTIIINDGPLMGYGIEGAFKSKAGYEIAREYLHVKYRDDVFGQIPVMDFSALQMGIERSATSLMAMLEARLQRLDVRVVQGKATFVDAHRVAVGDKQFSGDHVVIATGTRPRILPNMSVDGETTDHQR